MNVVRYLDQGLSGINLQIFAFKVEVFIVLHEAAANQSTIHV